MANSLQLAPSPAHSAAAAECWGTFQTRQVDDSADFIRTFGSVAQLPPGPLRFAADEACRYVHPDPPPDCARGKVVAFAQHGSWCETTCYQLSDCHTRAELVACCNGTAVAAAAFSALYGPRHVPMQVELPGRKRLEIANRVQPGASGVSTVQQSWRQVGVAVQRETWVDGRACAVCSSPLNNYLLIRARPDEDVHAFTVSEALEMWQRFGFVRASLLSRIAVLQAGRGRLPSAKFFTCGERAHPSAPLTGLAVLAIAAQELGWLDPEAQHLQTPAGPIALPRVELVCGLANLAFSPVLVQLDLEAARLVDA